MTPTDDHFGAGTETAAADAGGPVDDTIDAYGQHCGMLEPSLKARLDALEPGAILEVRADDPSVPAGIAAWCRLTGNELLSSEVGDDGDARFLLRKAGE